MTDYRPGPGLGANDCMKNMKNSEPEVFRTVSEDKKLMQLVKQPMNTALLIAATSLLLACGGGGGGGSSDSTTITPVTVSYAGKTTPAAIDNQNAFEIVQSVLDGTSASTSFTIASAQTTEQPPVQRNALTSGQVLSILPHISRFLRSGLSDDNSIDTSVTRIKPAAVDFNDTLPCDFSDGTIRSSGVISDNGTGTLTFDFRNCQLIDEYIEGRVIYQIAAFDFNAELPTDATIRLESVTLRRNDIDVIIGGSIRSILDLSAQTESLTINIIIQDSATGKSAKYENMAMTLVHTDINSSLQVSVALNGRYYNSDHGYVDITTSSPWYYQNIYDANPQFFGSFTVTGLNNSSITIAPDRFGTMTLLVDTDGDNASEFAGRPTIDQIVSGPTTDESPVARTGIDFLARTRPIQLDGSPSLARDGDLLSFEWTIAQAPAGSNAVLENANTMTPTLIPDVAGDYVFSLRVSDGKTTSAPVTVTAMVPRALAADLFEGPVYKTISSFNVTAISSGDVNSDGLNDVVFVTSAGNSTTPNYKIMVYLQDSTGNLGTPVTYASGMDTSISLNQIVAVQIADLNNDNRNDVVISYVDNHVEGIGVLYQNLSGTLDPIVPYLSGNFTMHISVGDFNSDGLSDVATISHDKSLAPQFADIYLQNLAGTIDTAVSYPADYTRGVDLDSGDLNADGRTDLVIVSGENTDDFMILYQQIDGNMSAASGFNLPIDVDVSAISIGDINADTRDDVLVTYENNSNQTYGVAILLQNLSNGFDAPLLLPLPDSLSAVEVGDINGDGSPDIVALSPHASLPAGLGAAYIVLQQSDGSFADYIDYQIDNFSITSGRLVLEDINSDGRTDVVATVRNGFGILYGK